jgi:hypothetical protein
MFVIGLAVGVVVGAVGLLGMSLLAASAQADHAAAVVEVERR